MKKQIMEEPGASIPSFEDLEGWARQQVQVKLQSILVEEMTEFLGRAKSERQAAVDGTRGYRNGYGKPRRLAMMGGTITVRRPRGRGLEERFESRVLPLFVRRTQAIGDLLPELYLHGLSQGDFELALRGLLGEGAPLSPASIQRLRACWEDEYAAWGERDLSDRELVYLWADGLYVKAGLEKEKAALLVVIGAFRDGTKEVLAVVPGVRESKSSWEGVLRDLKRRGLTPPKLTVADGHLGIWAALAEIFPETEEQRCWNHRLVNVLDRLPRKLQSQARELLCQIPYAETRGECERRRDRFVRQYRRAYPQAVQILLTDWDRMVSFYDFPKAHWKHLRTTNVIESPFAALRLRTGAAKRYKNVTNATALIWRLLRVAEKTFRKIDSPKLAAEVYEGTKFDDGVRIPSRVRKAA